MDINKILNQMEATIELWENLKGDYKDSYLEFRYEETKTVCNFIKDCKYEIERLKKELEQQKLHNARLEQEMIDIIELLGIKEEAISFTDIKIQIQKLKENK